MDHYNRSRYRLAPTPAPTAAPAQPPTQTKGGTYHPRHLTIAAAELLPNSALYIGIVRDTGRPAWVWRTRAMPTYTSALKLAEHHAFAIRDALAHDGIMLDDLAAAPAPPER